MSKQKITSSSLLRQAEKLLVGAGNYDSGISPLVINRAKGSQLRDEDNTVYTDYTLRGGALIFGHANRNVVLSTKKTAERGINFNTISRHSVFLAKHITRCVPSIEKVLFVNDESRVLFDAVDIARAFTNKRLVAEFDGRYRNFFDNPAKDDSDEFVSLPFNNVDVMEDTLVKLKDKIACVVISPVVSGPGVVRAEKSFLKKLRDLSVKLKIVLIFDEVASGFRTCPGGAQAEMDIKPDITCLGNIMGGGFSLGAIGGRRDIMNKFSESCNTGDGACAGSNVSPVVLSAGLGALKVLNTGFYKSFNANCTKFTDDLNAYFKEKDIAVHLSNYGSMISIYFSKDPVLNYEQAEKARDADRYIKFVKHLLKNNIVFPLSQNQPFCISVKHTKKELNILAECVKVFFR